MSRANWPDLPTVSIVTPSYNQGQFIEATIKSILCQDYPNIEYIVLDSVSTDETQSILEKYRPWIKHLEIAKDKGQADAINRGLQYATGEILAYLNSDDLYYDATVVSAMVETFLQNPHVDVVTGKRIRMSEDGHFLKDDPVYDYSADILKRVCYIPQECTFWTREIYDRAGAMIDETYQFAMDYELWMRFIRVNAQWRMLDKWTGLFRWQSNQKTQTQAELVCNPEVWRLQSREGYMPLNYEEAGAANDYLYFGCSPKVLPKAFEYCALLWKELQTFKQKLYNNLRFDTWVEEADVTRPKLVEC